MSDSDDDGIDVRLVVAPRDESDDDGDDDGGGDDVIAMGK